MDAPAGARQGRDIEAPSLKRYFQTMVKYAWLIVLCTVLAGAAAAAYVKLSKKTYTAESQMLVSAIPTGSSSLVGLPLLFSSGDPTQDVLTGSSLITTPQVANAVINQLGLHESASALLSRVSATPIGQSSLVAIQATAGSARQAQAIANAFSQQVIATRTAALHAAIAPILGGVRAAAARQPQTVGPQLSELETLNAGADPTIQAAAPATLPTAPTSPKTKLSLIAGVLAGLILGIAAAFGFNAFDTRLRREEQVEELFDVPVLAHIPREPGKHDRPMIPSELSFGAQEGFRTLRAVLSARAARKPRAYLVTGSSPGEGKTTSAIGLAAALAQSGARVILIEADLRRPTIGSTLALRPRLGTEHVMSGEASLKDALKVVRFDGSPLGVLAVRTPNAKLADRLTVSVAKRLIDSALAMADHVVIDSPPLTEVSDAMPLAHQAHEVIVVARVGVSKLIKLSALRNLLRQQNAYPSGIVLVGEAPERGSSYYYYSPEAPESSAEASTPSPQRSEASGPAERTTANGTLLVDAEMASEASGEEPAIEAAGPPTTRGRGRGNRSGRSPEAPEASPDASRSSRAPRANGVDPVDPELAAEDAENERPESAEPPASRGRRRENRSQSSRGDLTR